VSTRRYRDGLALAIGSYIWWGFFPLYLLLARPTSSLELIAQRVVWSLLVCVLLVGLTGQRRVALAALRNRRQFGLLTVAGLLLTINWLTFIYATLSGQVIDAALGYFISPLLAVAMGVTFLGERLAVVQWTAVGVAAIGMSLVWWATGHLPWIALTVALTFAVYSFIEKTVGQALPTLTTLGIETLVVAPVAVGVLIWFGVTGRQSFLGFGAWHALAIVGLGVVTVVPLLLCNGGLRRIPLSTMGQIQFLGPVLQFLVGVIILGEAMPLGRWLGFAAVWVALVILGADASRRAWRRRSG